MKHTIKRLLGLALILVLMLGLVPLGTGTAHAAEEYNLWVGSEQVTSENLSGDGWSYAPASHTLTLNNAAITGTHGGAPSNIYAAGMDLTVELVGSNSLSGGERGIYLSNGSLTVKGTGSLTATSSGVGLKIVGGGLTVTGGCKVTTSAPNGLSSVLDLKIEDSTVSVTNAGNYGLETLGSLTVTRSTVTCSTTGYYGVSSRGQATFTDSYVSSSAGNCAISCDGGISLSGKMAVIEPAGGAVSGDRIRDSSGATAKKAVLDIVYTVNASAYPTDGGAVVGGGSYRPGVEVTVKAIHNEYYHFVNWTENKEEVSTNAEYSFTVNSDRTLVANFELNTYTIDATAEPTNGGTVDGAGTYDFGKSATLTATPATGYHFVNWTEGGEEVSTSAVYSFTVEGDRTLVANFELNTYTVNTTVDPAGGGAVSGGNKSYKYGETVTLTATPGDHYEFVNWTEKGTEVSKDNPYVFTVESDRDLVANFELQKYTIDAAASPEAGGTVSGGGTYDYGTIVTLKAAAKEGYAFVNWTENGKEVGTKEEYTLTVEGDRTLTANFVKLYTVKFESNGGSAVAEQTVKEGEKAAKPADPTRTDYIFQGWYSDKDLTKAYDFGAAVKADLTLYAKWKEDIKYTVTKGNNSVVNKGGTADLELTVKRNFHDEACFTHFLKVQLDGKDLVKDTDYTAKSGSTVVTIKHETLNKLTTGKHTITVVFDDGYATAYITVKAGSGGTNTTPKTGDRSTTGLWIALIAAALALGAVGYLLLQNRRKALAEAAPAEAPAEEIPAPEEKKE